MLHPMRKSSSRLFQWSVALAAAAFALIVSCADRKEIEAPQTHVEGWMDQSSASFHGAKLENINLISCQECHGNDHRGGTSGVSCYKCHAGGPSGHPGGWMDTTSAKFHGPALAARGMDECAACHGEDFRGRENNGSSCYLCHGGPSGHPATGWLSKTNANFHGLDASIRGLEDCALCHGQDFSGGISGTSCSACHPDKSGHPASGWLDRASDKFHATRMVATGMNYCAGCHGADFKGGDSGISCYQCHDGPSGHPATGWLDKTSASFHGLSASSRGLENCAVCHGADFRGGISGSSCYTCHSGPSGHPAVSDWLNAASPRFHGVRLSKTGTQYCGGCHGADFTGGYAKVSCFTCHDGPSGHPYGWLDRNAGQNFHGTIIQQQGVASCMPCHGQDMSGGISGVACAQCH